MQSQHNFLTSNYIVFKSYKGGGKKGKGKGGITYFFKILDKVAFLLKYKREALFLKGPKLRRLFLGEAFSEGGQN